MPRRPDLPEYAVCERCGEYRRATLRAIEGQVLCANCADTRHQRLRCLVCDQVLPCQEHHLASKILFPTLTCFLCLNDHRIISGWQYAWRRHGWPEAHPFAALVLGVWDLVRLWLQRSPAAPQCRDLLFLLGRAALCLLPYLRFDAVAELRLAMNRR
jgi:hypothetical protein